jgi:HEAT repeat protein
MRPFMDDNDKTKTKKSTETKTHTIVKKSKDLWREKERQRLLDQAKIEEFERAERKIRRKVFLKGLIVFFIPISTIVALFYIISANLFVMDVYTYDYYSADYSVIKPIIKILRKGTTEEKLVAIDFLGSTLNPKAIRPLIEAYPDEDESVNVAILETLAGPWDSRSIKPFSKAMSHKDSSIRRSAIISLGKRTEYQVVPILYEALLDSDEKVRELAFLALSNDNGKMDVDLLFPILIKALYDKDERVRELAALTFSNPSNYYTKEVKYFIPALKDSNSNVRKYMIETFTHSDFYIEAYNQIIDIFLNDEVLSVRVEAARALSTVSLADHKALDYLIPVVLDDVEDPEVIRAALYSIIVISKDYVIRVKKVRIFETREEVVIDIAKKLKGDKYKYRHPLYFEATNDVIFKPRTSALSSAIIFLEELGYSEALPVLIEDLRRQKMNFPNRPNIYRVGELGNTRAIKTLISALDDPDVKIRESALLSLEKITGQNFGDDKDMWRKWLKENEQTVPFEKSSVN